MALELASWLPQAQQLTLGQRRRFDHDCGPGRTLIAAHTDDGYNAYCWRCSDNGFHGHPQPSMAERLAKLRAVQQVEAEVKADIRPPMPAEFNPSLWPLVARVWLYKAGFSNELIQRAGFYYCARIERVVMPVVHEGRLVFWQARGFDKDRAKYINPPVDRSTLAPLYPVQSVGSRAGEDRRDKLLVLTEDIISAIRVGAVTRCRSLMGTAITDPVLLLVKAHKLPVGVWLDSDAPGRRASAKVVRKLLNNGIQARAIHTPLDPKCYSNEEIAAFLLN